MPYPNHLEQETIEKVQPREVENKAALESRIDQSQPAADASTNSAKTASDNQTFKNELPAKQYDAKTEVSDRLTESEPVRNQKAYQAAETAIAGNEQAANHPLYARRYASEAAALTNVGGDAANLDAAASKMGGFKGDNYPTYDITSSKEVASVKTHWDANGNLSESAIRNYRHDFNHMMGWNRDVNGLQQDGQNILAARDAGLSVPSELQSATPDQAATYLRNNSSLRIPDDHVNPVRDAINNDIRQFPQNYHLSENPSQVEIDHILNRIQGIGLKSSELQNIIQR